MGEDFIEKKNRQFKRCTDAAYEDWKAEEDLFSVVSPDTSSEVVGYLMAGATLEVGNKVMLLPVEDGGVTAYHGAAPVAQLVGEAAALAGQVADELGAPPTAEVTELLPDGIVKLCFHEPYKN